MKLPITILLATSFVLTATTASAQVSFRCGEQIIQNGDSQTRVLEYCGEPTNRNGNYWTYVREGKLTVLVQFQFDGTIYRIQEQATQ